VARIRIPTPQKPQLLALDYADPRARPEPVGETGSVIETGGVLRTVEVASADDPRLAEYSRLTDAGLRTHLEA